jgi:hypothetical protein
VDDGRQRGDISSITKVLMADDRFTDNFGLCYVGLEFVFQQVESYEAALKLEAQTSILLVRGDSGDVV